MKRNGCVKAPPWISFLLILSSLLSNVFALDVKFEDPTSAFFFRERDSNGSQTGNRASTSIVLNGGSSNNSPRPSELPKSKDSLHNAKFAVLQSNQPVVVRAEYGPFLHRQTVPKSYIIPDLSESLNSSTDEGLLTQYKSHSLDLSAQIVSHEIPLDFPLLRVLFHVGTSANRIPKTICIHLHVTAHNQTKSNACSPNGKDGTCLGQIRIPSSWWPSFTQWNASLSEEKLLKTPKIHLKVFYFVEENRHLCGSSLGSSLSLIPETLLGRVLLVPPSSGYTQLAADEIVHMLLPQAPLYPNSIIYVPVFLDQPSEGSWITSIRINCRSRGGIKILGIEESSSVWNTRIEMNDKQSQATVLVFTRKDSLFSIPKPENSTYDYNGSIELFNWLLSVDDREFKIRNSGKILWNIDYNFSVSNYNTSQNKSNKLTAKLRIQKDEVQSVLPIFKQTEVMNLAILTGRQISRPLKVFIVSHSGNIADVTLGSQCTSTDNFVLKVSSSCTSVYVDGSESRGSLSARIIVKYGSTIGEAFFIVWMPELPLTISLSDNKLSQIKGWRVPYNIDISSPNNNNKLYTKKQLPHSKKDGGFRASCSYRYQQSSFQIFGRFVAEDLDSGRKEYFPSRNSELDLTELLIFKQTVRVLDPSIAVIRNDVIQGLSPGRTNIQVISPISGQELGSAEISVVKNRESIIGMKVRILSGLSLNIYADPNNRRNKYSIQTSYSKILTSKYQEGLVDVNLLFSDETSVPLKNVDSKDYYLSIKSLNPQIIAFAPRKDSYSRIIAVASGHGKLLRISFEITNDCMIKAIEPLATQDIELTVEIDGEKKKNENTTLYPVVFDLGDMVQDEEKPSLSSKIHHQNHFSSSSSSFNSVSSLEVGLYALMAVFLGALTVFLTSCFVYATRIVKKPVSLPPHNSSHHSEQNAHDWVWLGKSGNEMAAGSLEQRKIKDFSFMNVIHNPIPPAIPPHRTLFSDTYTKKSFSQPSMSSQFFFPMSNPRQSPASALPPLSDHESLLFYPSDIQRPFGEYISLNPDINLPSPPRSGFEIPQDRFRTYNVKSSGAFLIEDKDKYEERAEETKNLQSNTFDCESSKLDYESLMSYFDGLKESKA